jgi:hypothetical protein
LIKESQIFYNIKRLGHAQKRLVLRNRLDDSVIGSATILISHAQSLQVLS